MSWLIPLLLSLGLTALILSPAWISLLRYRQLSQLAPGLTNENRRS